MAKRAEVHDVGRNRLFARVPAKQIDYRNTRSARVLLCTDDSYFEPYFDSLLSATTYFCNSEPNSTSELMHCRVYKTIAASSTSCGSGFSRAFQ